MTANSSKQVAQVTGLRQGHVGCAGSGARAGGGRGERSGAAPGAGATQRENRIKSRAARDGLFLARSPLTTHKATAALEPRAPRSACLSSLDRASTDSHDELHTGHRTQGQTTTTHIRIAAPSLDQPGLEPPLSLSLSPIHHVCPRDISLSLCLSSLSLSSVSSY